MFGLGSALTTYNSGFNNPTFSGTNPAAFLELGWQGLKYEKSFYRFGWKNQCFFEPEKVHCGSGLEISAGWNF